MPVVPISQQRKRQQQPIADPKFLLMAAAMMRAEGKLQPQPSERSKITDSNPASAALQSIQPQTALS